MAEGRSAVAGDAGTPWGRIGPRWPAEDRERRPRRLHRVDRHAGKSAADACRRLHHHPYRRPFRPCHHPCRFRPFHPCRCPCHLRPLLRRPFRPCRPPAGGFQTARRTPNGPPSPEGERPFVARDERLAIGEFSWDVARRSSTTSLVPPKAAHFRHLGSMFLAAPRQPAADVRFPLSDRSAAGRRFSSSATTWAARSRTASTAAESPTP